MELSGETGIAAIDLVAAAFAFRSSDFVILSNCPSRSVLANHRLFLARADHAIDEVRRLRIEADELTRLAEEIEKVAITLRETQRAFPPPNAGGQEGAA